MKTAFYLNGKKITKKALIAEIGPERFARWMASAKVTFMEDPGTCIEFMLGSHRYLEIRFS